jgi:hypothetical protein
MKEFIELKLGSMTMIEYERRFLELLRYIGFIKDEEVKIKIFLSGLSSLYIDKIQFDDPRTLEEALRKYKYLYEKSKERPYFQRAWDYKKTDKMDQRKKIFKPPLFKNNSQSHMQGN